MIRIKAKLYNKIWEMEGVTVIGHNADTFTLQQEGTENKFIFHKVCYELLSNEGGYNA